MDTLRRRKAREKMRMSSIMPGELKNEEDLEGNLDELIDRLYSGEPWTNFTGKKRNRRASSNTALSRLWMQVSRERLDISDTPQNGLANGIEHEEC